MCGIVGIASRSGVFERGSLLGGRESMVHRGPDGEGEWRSADGKVGLAHRRLAIVELSEAGRQPMLSSVGEAVIVFNGEIYNFQDLRAQLEGRGHAFRSRSDTEVILEAYREWGLECPSRLNGAFAFALYDPERRRLFFCRDRAGEKPLFYAAKDGEIRFASELKALMADPAFPRRVDREALDCYLAFGFVPGERCILEGVKKLPPAHAMTFDVDSATLKVWRYWSPPAARADESADEAGLVAELESLLEDSVKRQLVADVPVGVLLSGGVDSGLITAMAARARSRVRTFTVRFPGHGALDETGHARLIAERFGTEHLELDGAECSPDLLPVLARQFDEPVVDSSMIPTYLVTKLVRAHCTVALGGDGGDELFGGYGHYNRMLWLAARAGRVPRGLRAGLAWAAERALPVGFKGRNWAQALSADFEAGVPLIASYFDTASRGRLLAGAGRAGAAEAIRRARVPAGSGLLDRATRMDFENYLPEDILVKVDRASMLNSLEVRAPFLDHRIIEFAFGRVPESFKATETGRKLILKSLCAKILPPEFDKARKQGFSIPLAEWLKGGRWRDYFRSVLLDTKAGPFAPAFVRGLLDGQDRGRANSERLFALVMFELWRREYRVAFARDS